MNAKAVLERKKHSEGMEQESAEAAGAEAAREIEAPVHMHSVEKRDDASRPA